MESRRPGARSGARPHLPTVVSTSPGSSPDPCACASLPAKPQPRAFGAPPVLGSMRDWRYAWGETCPCGRFASAVSLVNSPLSADAGGGGGPGPIPLCGLALVSCPCGIISDDRCGGPHGSRRRSITSGDKVGGCAARTRGGSHKRNDRCRASSAGRPFPRGCADGRRVRGGASRIWAATPISGSSAGIARTLRR
jgi:hypothetical protein